MDVWNALTNLHIYINVDVRILWILISIFKNTRRLGSPIDWLQFRDEKKESRRGGVKNESGKYFGNISEYL